ncbi:HEL309Wp [Eremothecium sinecaudum]|uniref:Mitochondrial genome maintenance protein MGM101 n=1 Tax=Eremothecium sinecaudum TaxID=45286 RepID=A0A109UX91_9SACH|nr:HEL309Wp [Eremothecium sinecaudum]AMD20972.1 HEL309Wp [Eremothecium sinecaudum]
MSALGLKFGRLRCTNCISVYKRTFTKNVAADGAYSSTKPTLDAKKIVGSYATDLKSALGNNSLESVMPNVERLGNLGEIDWYHSFHGLGSKPFNAKVQMAVSKPLAVGDVEIKPDGLLYLPEIKYRRILNAAFGAGGWGLAPRSETIVTAKLVTREYALICHGQLVSVARGEQDYFNDTGIPTAVEGCKSNALMRCCKDLGIGSELWDPVFIKKFKKEHCIERFVEHVTTKRKKKIWLRKDREIEYPYKFC